MSWPRCRRCQGYDRGDGAFENFGREQVDDCAEFRQKSGLLRGSEAGGRRGRGGSNGRPILGGGRADTIVQQQEKNGAETAAGRFRRRVVATPLQLEPVRKESGRQFQIGLAGGQGEGEAGEGLLVQPEISKGGVRAAGSDRGHGPNGRHRQRPDVEEEHLSVSGQPDERAIRGEGGEEEGQAPFLVETIFENGLEEGRGHGRGWVEFEDRRDTLDPATETPTGDHTPPRVGWRCRRGGRQRSDRQGNRGSTGFLWSQERCGKSDSIPLVQRIARR